MVFRVDRQGFFVALASIAACGAPSAPPVLTVVSVPVQPNDPPLPIATSAPSSTPTPPPTASSPIATSPPGPSEEGSAPTSEGGGPSNEGSGDDGAMCRSKAVKRPVACADDRGTPGDCKKNCAAGFVCDQCESYKRFFKPKIAERAVACVIGQTRKQAQDGCRTYQCGDEALKGACIDTTADVECKAIATKCKTTVAECRGMLSGMNAGGRALIASCAAKGCPYGLWSCIEGI